MPSIKKVTPMTENPYVRLYHLDVESKTGKAGHYYVASRAKDERHLKLNTGENYPDGVIIYAVCKEDKNKVVLVRQYRYAIDDYIYEFPAGLVETGEDFKTAGIREMKEETGLTLEPVTVNPAYEKPYFTTIGMTDESCATVYGYASGTVSRAGLEDSEELEIVLADKEEVITPRRMECIYWFEHLAACPEVSEQVKLGELHYENYEEGKIAAPKSLIYYVTHQATFKRDLKNLKSYQIKEN